MKSLRTRLGLFARDALVSTLVAAIAFGPAALPALAGPRNPQHGSGVSIDHVEGSGQWLIHAPDGSIIRYDSFDIALGEAVRFNQTIGGVASRDARVLNRILNGDPTRIQGSLTGNGHIYIVNPAGVFFADGAVVNANAIHAAGGNLSDANFENKVDRYTGVIGNIENHTDIIATKAISLVGAKVTNSGQVIAEDGWVVIAAGNDVLVGRDGAGGPMLKIEGAAGAVFDASATGVENTGTIEARGTNPDAGIVKVGAGDLYGTAIFSNDAIRARELALSAGNRGDIALANTVEANKVDISFSSASGPSTSGVGELRSVTAGEAMTVRANELKLSASGTAAQVRVSDDIAFRSQGVDPAVGPNKVTIEQTATLSSARLTTLDIGANTPGTTRDLALRSTAGNVVVRNEDKVLLGGSKLALSGALADIQGTDALNVASLAVTGTAPATDTAPAVGGNATSAGDIVASTGGISVTGNLQLVTKPDAEDDPTIDMLVSAHGGTLDVDGNVSTSAGGRLRIEAQSVDVGSTITTTKLPVGGTITSRGGVQIVATAGVGETPAVRARTIDARGTTGDQGGHVDVAAIGNVSIGTIVTNGGADSSTSQPNADGGSVSVVTGSTALLEIGAVATGGATAADRGAITLEGGTVVLSGGINATGGAIATTDGVRDRAVRVTATGALHEIQLGENAVSVAGSDVTLDGALRGTDLVQPADTLTRRVDLAIAASGTARLGSADLKSLAIASKGESVVLGGNIDADTTVKIGFDSSGIGTISNAGAPVTVSANRVELEASDSSVTDGRAAQLTLGEGIGFDLTAIPATATTELKAATLVLDQDGAIDSARVSRLANAVVSPPDVNLELRSNDAVTLDAAASTAVTGTKLLIASRSFVATDATQSASDFNLASLDLSTRDALDVNFGVTAEKVRLAGAGSGTGDLTLRSALRADTIALEAGNGSTGSGNDSKVVFGTGASLRSTDSASVRPNRVDLIQDAAIDSANLPSLATFGGSVAGLEYGLESRDGAVTLSAGTSDKFAGSALELRGRTGVNLGSEALSLASLTAETPAGLVVSQQITATATDGKIRLRAGSDGTGNLEVDARLAANTIELVAGSGNAIDLASRIQLDPGARFSAATGDARPDKFVFEQDAAIGTTGGGGPNTAVPGLALFGGNIDGMDYTLRSNGAEVLIGDTSSVNNTKLTLAGKSVDLNGTLNVTGLDLTGDTTLSGDLTSTGNVTVNNRLTLDGTGTEKDQSVSAGAGILEAKGAIVKSGAGAVELGGRQVKLDSVTTGRTGDSLTITGVESVTTGALDAAGTFGTKGGAVSVSATSAAPTGQVVIASITTRGGNGKVSSSAPDPGMDGGTVDVTGSSIEIGNVNSSGGDASAIAIRRRTEPETKVGGNASAITLTAGQITLNGSLDARGGAGAANDLDLVADLTGNRADVTVHGAILLAANSVTGGVNAIRGNNVVVDGGVSRATTREVGQTAFVVSAQDSLSFGGNLSADRIDLELANGNLDLAAGGVSEISANTIRLAATDGNGGNTERQVILTGVTLENEAGSAGPKAFTLEQDQEITGTGSLPSGIGITDRSVALISHDGGITLGAADVATLTGAKLTLAANGAADAEGAVIRVTGPTIDVAGLTIGNVDASGARVDGDALIDGNLVVGSSGLLSYAALLDVTGDAAIGGNASFAGSDSQALHVGPGETLSLGGGFTSKSTTGKLTLDADAIELTGTGAQTIENLQGQLEVGSTSGTGLAKGTFDVAGNPVPATLPANLTLRGSAEEDTGPAVTVNGTRAIGDGRDYAIAVADGDLTVDARVLASDTNGPSEAANWSVDGDVLAHGDVALGGRGVFAGGRDDYLVTARRAAQTSTTSRGGDLFTTGIAAADGDLTLRAEGDAPTEAIPTPSALFLGGEFDVAHGLTLSGVTEAVGDTIVRAGGDVVLESLVRGLGALSIASGGTVDIQNDVALEGSAFEASGANGILFTSAEGTQTIQAGSLSFGSGDAKPPRGQASILRDGDLKLHATNGSAKIGKGQRLVVAGDLDISAKNTVVLADTAALSVDVTGRNIEARGGVDVVANRISVSNRPSARGPGSASFATPTRENFSGDIAGADVILRQISGDPVQLSQADLAAGNFPTVNGPALFDYATQIPRLGRPASIVRPRANVESLALARDARPLWADELLVYLDAQSRRAPTPREQGALPPVSAGPNATTPDTSREVASPAVEQALIPYRALFRPSTEVDPETGIVQGEDRAPEIRAAFAKAVDVATARDGASPTAASVAAAIESDPTLADARIYRAELKELVAAGNRALDADQRARFRELLLARVAPTGMSPAEFNALIP